MKKEMKEIDMPTYGGTVLVKPRRDRGLPQLTKRDRMALSWIGEQYTVRFDTLTKLLGRMPGKSQNAPREPGKISPSSVNRAIKRWELLGLVETQKMWREEPKWVWLTSVGLRMQGLSYAPYSPAKVQIWRISTRSTRCVFVLKKSTVMSCGGRVNAR